jgi:hypothetical protein
LIDKYAYHAPRIAPIALGTPTPMAILSDRLSPLLPPMGVGDTDDEEFALDGVSMAVLDDEAKIVVLTLDDKAEVAILMLGVEEGLVFQLAEDVLETDDAGTSCGETVVEIIAVVVGTALF